MLIMFEERTRGGICQAAYRYAKANNKYMKKYDKNKESSFLIYDDANNLNGWQCVKSYSYAILIGWMTYHYLLKNS